MVYAKVYVAVLWARAAPPHPSGRAVGSGGGGGRRVRVWPSPHGAERRRLRLAMQMNALQYSTLTRVGILVYRYYNTIACSSYYLQVPRTGY